MPNPAVPPPFQPYRANPDVDAKQNLVGFLEWVADGIYRIHQLSDASYRYTRAMYEHEARKAAVAGQSRPAASVSTQQVLFDLGKIAIQNRHAFASFLKGFIK